MSVQFCWKFIDKACVTPRKNTLLKNSRCFLHSWAMDRWLCSLSSGFVSVLLKSDLCFQGEKTQSTSCSVFLISGCFKTNQVHSIFFFLFFRVQTDQHLSCKLYLRAVLYKPWFIRTPHFWGSCWDGSSRMQWKCYTDRKSQISRGQRTERILKKIKSLLKYDKKVIPAQEKQVKMRLLALKIILRFPCELHFSV